MDSTILMCSFLAVFAIVNSVAMVHLYMFSNFIFDFLRLILHTDGKFSFMEFCFFLTMLNGFAECNF